MYAPPAGVGLSLHTFIAAASRAYRLFRGFGA